jgi:hypothetical protein
MNKIEIKSYLRDVYGVKVDAVSTQVVLGESVVVATVTAWACGGGGWLLNCTLHCSVGRPGVFSSRSYRRSLTYLSLHYLRLCRNPQDFTDSGTGRPWRWIGQQIQDARLQDRLCDAGACLWSPHFFTSTPGWCACRADCLLPFCVYTSCWVYFLVEIFCFSLNCSASQLFLESSPHCLPKTRGFVHSCIRPHTRRFLQAEEEEPFVYPDLFPDDEDEGKGTTGGASA